MYLLEEGGERKKTEQELSKFCARHNIRVGMGVLALGAALLARGAGNSEERAEN